MTVLLLTQNSKFFYHRKIIHQKRNLPIGCANDLKIGSGNL